MVVAPTPTATGILADAAPEATTTPFTFIVALPFCAVGVTVTDVVALLTDVVYVVVVPTVPVLVSVEAGVSLMVLSWASFDNFVTTIE